LPSPSGSWVAAITRPPAPQCKRHQLSHQPLPAAIQRREGLIQQPQGPATDQQPRQRQPPLLSGRQIAARQSALPRQTHLFQHRGAIRKHCDTAGIKRQLLEDGDLLLSVRLMPQPGGITAALSPSLISPLWVFSTSAPPAGVRKPAIRRSSEVLPAPLAPSTASACPAPTRKLTPATACGRRASKRVFRREGRDHDRFLTGSP